MTLAEVRLPRGCCRWGFAGKCLGAKAWDLLRLLLEMGRCEGRTPPPQLCKAGPELLGPRLLRPLLQLELRQRVLVLGTIPRKASWERCGRSAGRLLRWSSHHPGWHSTDGARQATAGLVLVPDDLVPVSSLRGPPFPQVCMEGLDLSAL